MPQIKSGIRGQVDWPNVQGDGWSSRFRISRGGVYPATWTGYVFIGQVRKFLSPTAALVADISFDLTEGNGWVTMSVTSHTVRRQTAPMEYYYDVKWAPPAGELKTLFGGRFPVGPRVAVETP